MNIMRLLLIIAALGSMDISAAPKKRDRSSDSENVERAEDTFELLEQQARESLIESYQEEHNRLMRLEEEQRSFAHERAVRNGFRTHPDYVLVQPEEPWHRSDTTDFVLVAPSDVLARRHWEESIGAGLHALQAVHRPPVEASTRPFPVVRVFNPVQQQFDLILFMMLLGNLMQEHPAEDPAVRTARINAFMTQLPVQRLTNNEIMCSVCRENAEEEPEGWVQLTCGHYFHKDCLTQWLIQKETCPNCRTTASTGASTGGEG